MINIDNIIFIALLLLSSSAFAQLHDAHWIFGENFAPDAINYGLMNMNFELEPTYESRIEGDIRFTFTNASFSDKDGNLKTFTNGSTIFDQQGTIIPGAEDIHPEDNNDNGYGIIQGFLYLPKPENDSVVYAITSDLFTYTENYDLKGGFDSLTFTSIYIKDSIYIEEDRSLIIYDTLHPQKLIATKHANGRDWWMLLNKYETNLFYKILLNPDGFHIYDTQEIGDTAYVGGIDHAHYSPDGSHYAVYSYSGFIGVETQSSIDLYNFDRCTGDLSNHQRHIFPSNNGAPGGVSFSPNSQYMYVSVWDSIVQYDLYAPDIFASEVTVAKYDGFTHPGPDSVQEYPTRFFQMQIAPNDKIYVNMPNVGSRYLHVIDQPNEKGLACNVLQHEVELPYFNFFSMPNFPNYRLGPLKGSACDTLGPKALFTFEADNFSHQFTDQSTNEPEGWIWSFGDGNTSMEQNPTHTYAAFGSYEVCLRSTNEYGSDRYCENVALIDVGVEYADFANMIKLFPNPTDHYLYLDFSPNIRLKQIEMFGITGKLISTFGPTNKIDLSQIAKGIYLIEVTDTLGRRVVKRILKQ